MLSGKFRLRDILTILEMLSYLLALYVVGTGAVVIFAIPAGWIPNLSSIAIWVFIGGLLLTLSFVFLVAAISAGIRESRSARRQVPNSPVSQANPTSLEEVARLLQAIEANTRLSEKEKLERSRNEKIDSARQAIARYVEEARWSEAEALAGELGRLYSGDPEAGELSRLVERSRDADRARQLQELEANVKAHVEARRWTEARQALEELKTDFPDSPEAVELAELICLRQQQAFEEEKHGLIARIDGYIRQEHWQEALEGARDLISRYPKTPEAEELRRQTPELEMKAGLRQKGALFVEIKTLVARRQYQEAYQRALRLLSEFAESKEADIVRRDLSELRSRAQSGKQENR